MKKLIRITESDIHNMVNRALNEIGDTFRGQYMLGRLAQRKAEKGEDDGSIKKYASEKRSHAPGSPAHNAYSNGYHVSPKNVQRGYNHYKGWDDDEKEWERKQAEKEDVDESIINRAVRRTINEMVNEISDDTIDSASHKSWQKYWGNSGKYGEDDPRTSTAYDQAVNFSRERDKRYSSSKRRAARIEKNNEDRKSGKRTYQKGRGWVTNED